MKRLIHETAIHFVDLFRYLLGRVHSVFAQLRRLNPAILGEDAGVVLFEFAGNARAIFDGSRLIDHAADDRRLTMGDLIVEGSQGVLRLDGYARLSFRQFARTRSGKLTSPGRRRGSVETVFGASNSTSLTTCFTERLSPIRRVSI